MYNFANFIFTFGAFEPFFFFFFAETHSGGTTELEEVQVRLTTHSHSDY